VHVRDAHRCKFGVFLRQMSMCGIRRTIGTVSTQKVPATADIIGEMLKHWPDTLAGKRDRALLALGFAGLPHSEPLVLRIGDLAEIAHGLRVTIRRSKTDQEGRGTGSPSRAAIT
jgi:hypothetical protein